MSIKTHGLMKNFLLSFIVFFILPASIFGQSDSYYSTINPANSSFITDLEARIRSPYTKISYDQFDETNVANFASRDTVISGTTYGVFTDVYSGENCVYTKPFAWGSTYSREHTWCQSWFPVASTSNEYYSDQHHLFPVQQNHTNVVRSNNPLGIVKTISSSFMEAKLGNDSTGKLVYEPRACHKGDAARALLYMAVRYNGVYGDWSFNYLNSNYLASQQQDVATLLKWNKEDPPDKWEVDRNNYVQSIQQNRNPFVDHPEYVNYINFNDISKLSPSYATEPTFGPSNLVVQKGANSITISWSNVTSGGQLASGYVLEGFTTNTYFIPIDGEVYTNDTLLSDGGAVVSITNNGTQSYTFYNVDTSLTYYFRMYTYNGDATLRNYKTDGYGNSFNLLQPSGGESISASGTYKIIWSSLNITNVKLEYSTDGGTNWTTIIASTPASTGYYTWTVPSVVSSNCKVRISDASTSSTNAVSASTFSITQSSSFVSLSSPVGGESWQVSSSHNITWTYSGVTNVKLEYTTDSGSSWNTIISSTGAIAGSYSWTIPNAVSANCKVRISDASNSATSSVSTGVFSIIAAPVLTLTSPVGGENWVGNSSHNITWSSTNVSNVKLEYTTDSGSNWNTIISSTAASAGSYSWTIPNVSSTNCKVRVSDVSGGAAASLSSSVFTITQIVAAISLTSPAGGESWAAGSSHNITWTSSNITNVKLEYTTDAGSNWTTIIASTAASTGSYGWTIPNVSSTNCKVRVSDASNASTSATSASIFTITLTTSLSLTSPVGGESWVGSSSHNVTWTSSNITNVKLEYTTDAGSNWTTIIASTAASAGSYSWTLPNVASTNCKVRVSDASNASSSSISASVFTITLSSSLTLTSPVGGESWLQSSVHSITWSSSNVNAVKLEYSTDSGSSWTTITAAVAAPGGSYSWTLPTVSSTTCKVRVSDTSNAALNSVSTSVFTITASSYVSPANFGAGLTLTQNFDSLGVTAIATLPFRWKVDKNTTVRTVGTYTSAVSATEQYAGNTMSSTAANGIYNYGAGTANSATDRAVGGLSSSSSSKSVNIYTALTNAGVGNLSGLQISYDIEKYRTGTNAAGFSVQMYYSTDGSTWTNAGTDFLTSFAGDATTAGYASAPGTTSSVSNKTLAVSVSSGSTIYLAWNYAVTSGTTTTYAQALGLDNVSITGLSTSAAPTTQASNISFSSVQTTQMTASWTNGNGAGRIVKMNKANSFTAPTDGVTYTANSTYGGSGEQVIFSGAGNSLTLNGLTASTAYYFKVYEYNGTGSSIKYQTADATNNPNTQTTAAVVISAASDIIANAAFTTPANINYTQYQDTSLSSSSLEVAKFDIRDGGAAADADLFGTTLTSITFGITNPGNLRKVGIFDGTTKLAETTAASSITFSSLSLAATDGSIKSLSLRVSFLSSVTDNQQFAFTVTSASALTGGSQFAAADAGGAVSSTSGNANKVAVTATKLNFVQQPGDVMTGNYITPAVTVEGIDSFNNRDLDDTESVTITANGSVLTGSPVSVSPVSGLATFSTLAFSSAGSGVSLIANASGLTGATSTTFTVQPAGTYTWIGSRYANWTDAANWSPVRTTPSTSDIMQFSNGDSVIVNSVPTQTIGKLLISNNTRVKLRAAAAVTLTVGSASGQNFSVASGSTLNLGSTAAISLALPTGTTGIVAGTVLCDSAAHKILPTDSAALSFQSGSIITQNCSGNLFGNTGTANVVMFENGSTLVFKTGSNPFALTAPNSRIVFKTGSTYRHESSNSPSLVGRVYANFEMNNASTITTTSSGNFTCDNLKVTVGVLNLNITGTIKIKGNISVANGTTLNFAPLASATISLNGTVPQTISNAGTLNFGTYAGLAVNNSTGVTLLSDIRLKNVLTLTSGTLTLGSSNLYLDTNATISGTFSNSNMIIASGTGSVKKLLLSAAPHSFTFPVGDNTGYSPAVYTLNSGTFTGDTVSIRIISGKNTNNNNQTDYLNRSWALTSNGVVSPNYTAAFTYVPSDIAGTESNLSGGLWNNAAWTNLGAVNTTTHTLTANGLSVFGEFTAGAASGFLGIGYLTVKVVPQGYYNSGGFLNSRDTVKICLAQSSAPYTIVDSAYTILDSLSFNAQGAFSNVSSGSYYLVIKHRNSVETWSASPVSFVRGSDTPYDFTSAAAQAYNSNQIQVSTSPDLWAIYSGDVNQDGYVDPLDLSLIDQDSFNYAAGIGLVTDVNGDGYADPLDLSIADQNSFNYVGIQRPVVGKLLDAKARRAAILQEVKKVKR